MGLKYDSEKVTRLSSVIFDALVRLRELAAFKKEDLLAQPLLVGSAKYFLIVSVEAALDMCFHLISQNRWRVPKDYADTFRVMGDEGAFEPDFVKRLVEMAKFRNRLVHIYWDVDDDVIYEILQDDIMDIEKFLNIFIELLNTGK